MVQQPRRRPRALFGAPDRPHSPRTLPNEASDRDNPPSAQPGLPAKARTSAEVWSDWVAWFLGSLIYLALHALVYATVLRPRDAFRRERGIFAYHALSAVGVTLVVLARLALAPSLDTLATFVAVVCLHGIYSTSFLEVWSLSQASYSLKILRHVEETGEG